jgi:hypothetical protein
MMEAGVGPGRFMSRKGYGVAVKSRWKSMRCIGRRKEKGPTVSVGGRLPKNFVKHIPAFAIEEIGVHA